MRVGGHPDVDDQRFVRASITETVPESWLGTHTCEPSGETASAKGRVPTSIDAVMLLVAVSMTSTLLGPRPDSVKTLT